MPDFLTVKEAAERTGKSPSSIRRIIYPIIQNERHPDRTHIHPTIDEVQALRMKGENFAWRLSEELLRREIPLDTPSEKGSASAPRPQGGDGNAALVEMLRRELDIKNQQITQQGELIVMQTKVIEGLSERLREGNILMGTLQKQLSPPLPATDGVDEHRNATPSSPLAPEKGSRKGTKTPKQKRGFFKQLFH